MEERERMQREGARNMGVSEKGELDWENATGGKQPRLHHHQFEI